MKNPNVVVSLFVLVVILLASCSDDDAPAAENEEEIITDVTLTFTPASGSAIVATAQDPDGEGPENLEVGQAIGLATNTDYTLAITLENSIAGESITEEVEEEDEAHMLFFAWTQGLFTDPSGNGNVDTRADPVNYEDPLDDNGYPVGLETRWTTGDAATGTFRVLLKHQPPLGDGTPVKTATSTATDGESDVDLTWDVEIQ